MNTYKNIDIKNNNIILKEGILVDFLNISNTSNNICCINMNCCNCNKCYIKEYETEVNNTSNTNTNTNTNKPLIDLYTVHKKYNIDGIIFNNNKNDNIKNDVKNDKNIKKEIITITIKKH